MDKKKKWLSLVIGLIVCAVAIIVYKENNSFDYTKVGRNMMKTYRVSNENWDLNHVKILAGPDGTTIDIGKIVYKGNKLVPNVSIRVSIDTYYNPENYSNQEINQKEALTLFRDSNRFLKKGDFATVEIIKDKINYVKNKKNFLDKRNRTETIITIHYLGEDKNGVTKKYEDKLILKNSFIETKSIPIDVIGPL